MSQFSSLEILIIIIITFIIYILITTFLEFFFYNLIHLDVINDQSFSLNNTLIL
jgi:hypothetical protein